MKNVIIFSALFIMGVLFTTAYEINAGTGKVNRESSDSTMICIVSGEEFSAADGIRYKYLNREVTFCCEACMKAFKKEPAKYMKESLHCPVCNEDDARKDLSHTHEGVKYYFCGSGCESKFENEPQKYLDNYNK